MVVWDRHEYLKEVEKQLSDKNVYKEIEFKEKLIQDLTETSNKIFRNLRNGGFITDKELKYFSFDHKRACNLGKLYLLPNVMYLVDQGFLIVEHRQKKHLSFKIAILKLLCKKAGPT